jgi:hypothetical protein
MIGSFYEETDHVFNQFPTHHMKILFGDFNARVGKEDIFRSRVQYMRKLTLRKPTTVRKEVLYNILIKFGILMKLAKPTKMSSDKAYSSLHRRTYLMCFLFRMV